MFGLGMSEILLILAIALIVFGPKKLPELGRSLGQAMREFRNATNELRATLNIDDEVKAVTKSIEDIRDPLALKSKPAGKPATSPPEPPASSGGQEESPPAATQPMPVSDDDLPGTDLPAELIADFEKQGSLSANQGKSAS